MHGPLCRPGGYHAGIAIASDTPKVPGQAASTLDLFKEVVHEFREHDLLGSASAIAFQVLFATLPLVLVALAVLGFLGLEETWTTQGAPEARGALPPDAFSLLDRTIRSVLTSRQGTWLSVGLAFTLWRVSGVIRATSKPLNRLYDLHEDRSWVVRLRNSLLLAAVVLPCFVLAVTAVFAEGVVPGPGVVGLTLRWGIAVALLLTVVWLVLRLAPAARPPVHYVSLGAGVIVGGWIVGGLAYGLYVTKLASYESVFGSLATVIVLLTSAYLLALVFLGGAATDTCLRRRLDDDARVS